MIPTAEQETALALFAARRTFALNAFAGAGKTATLQLMASSTQRRGLYLAFNQAIAAEAKSKFPPHVIVKTTHALAFHAILQRGFSKDKLTGKLNANAIASVLSLQSLTFAEFELTRVVLAAAVRATVTKFSHSFEEEIGPVHVECRGVLQRLSRRQWRRYCAVIVAASQRLWNLMSSRDRDDVFLGHDGYFKLWSLSKPQLDFEFILVDEAQDSNPALLSVLRGQDAPIVFVGDRFQQIYQWRGAVSAMESFDGSAVAWLTQSFRFGEAIADVATKVLRVLDPTVIVRGVDKHSQLLCDDPDVVLTRSNSGLVREIIVARNAGKSFHVIGGTQELKWMLGDVSRLKARGTATHSEFYGFQSWEQVKTFVSVSGDSQLSTFVGLVEEYSEDVLLHILNEGRASMESADVSFSTVHKAKGLEFDCVVLSEDFPIPTPKRLGEIDTYDPGSVVGVVKDGITYELLTEEVRIFYVALTRARVQLQLPSWCYDFFDVKSVARTTSTSTSSVRHVGTQTRETIMERYAVVDFETSGLSPQNGDRAIEIGIAMVEGGRVVDTFDSVMRSDVVIYPHIEGLTGITQKMVDRAPEAETVMRNALAFVGDAQLVAHNASFDKKFWEREVRRATGASPPHDFLCTCLIARRLFQDLQNHRLDTVSAHLGITNRRHHRALGDAEAAAEVFVYVRDRIISTYSPSVPSSDFLKKYQKTSKQKLSSLSGSDIDTIGSGEIRRASATVVSKNDAATPDFSHLASGEVRIGSVEKRLFKDGSLRSLQVHMHHGALDAEKAISGRDAVLLEKKVSNQLAAWEKKAAAKEQRQKRSLARDELAQLEEEASEMTRHARENAEALASLLQHTLSVDDAIDWNQLYEHGAFSMAPAGTERIVYDEAGCPVDINLNET